MARGHRYPDKREKEMLIKILDHQLNYHMLECQYRKHVSY